MGFVENFQKLETLAEQSRDFLRTVTNNIETAAFLRPVDSEGRDDHVASIRPSDRPGDS